MSEIVNFAEFDRQYVEQLPARTVMSLLSTGGGAGTPGAGGEGEPGEGHNGYNVSTGYQVNIDHKGFSGHSGSANSGN